MIVSHYIFKHDLPDNKMPEERGECFDSVDETYISKMKFIRKLRSRIEVLLDNTYVALCTRTSHDVTPKIKQYAGKRQQMKRAGMSIDDIGYYDGRFRAMPWEIAGLETPKFEDY
jgi:hypothetical protein